MKKLIAIVITFIFIFEGTGYCLRKPLMFDKDYEQVSKTVASIANKISNAEKPLSIARKRQLLATLILGGVLLKWEIGDDGSIFIWGNYTVFSIDAAGNVTKTKLTEFNGSIKKESDLKPYENLLLKDYGYSIDSRRKDNVPAKVLYRRIRFFERKTGLKFNRNFIAYFVDNEIKTLRDFIARSKEINDWLKGLGVRPSEAQRILNHCHEKLLSGIGSYQRFKQSVSIYTETDVPYLFDKNPPQTEEGIQQHERLKAEAVTIFRTELIPEAIFSANGSLDAAKETLDQTIELAHAQKVRPEDIGGFFRNIKATLLFEGRSGIGAQTDEMVWQAPPESLYKRAGDLFYRDSDKFAKYKSDAIKEFKGNLVPVAVSVASNSAELEQILNEILDRAEDIRPAEISEFFRQEARFLRDFDAYADSAIKKDKRTHIEIRRIFKDNYDAQKERFKFMPLLSALEKVLGRSKSLRLLDKGLKKYNAFIDYDTNGNIRFGGKHADILDISGTVEVIKPESLAFLDIKEVVFDWDGTISTAIWFWEGIEAMAISQIGFSVEEARRIIKRTTGLSTSERMQFAIDEANARGLYIRTSKTAGELAKEAKEKIAIRWEEEKPKWGKASPLITGIIGLLKTLKENDIDCHVVTADYGWRKRKEAQLLEVKDYFKGGIHGDADPGYKEKEDYLRTLKNGKKKLSKNQICAIGDSEGDIISAVRAECVAIGVAKDAYSREILIVSGADIIINSDYSNLDGILDTLKIRHNPNKHERLTHQGL